MRRNIIIPNKRKHWFQSPIVAVFLVAIIIWASVVVVRMALTYREAAALRDQFQHELDELEVKQAELGEKIDNLSTERGLEAEIRNRYRVVKPGEQLVIIVDNASSTEAAEAAQPISFWRRLLGFVGL